MPYSVLLIAFDGTLESDESLMGRPTALEALKILRMHTCTYLILYGLMDFTTLALIIDRGFVSLARRIHRNIFKMSCSNLLRETRARNRRDGILSSNIRMIGIQGAYN